MNYNKSLRIGIFIIVLMIIPIPIDYVMANTLPDIILEYTGWPLTIGLIAYVWMLFIMYMGTKPRWIDNLIGLPKAYMIHGILSFISIFFAFLHKENLSSGGLVEKTGDISFFIFVAVAAYSTIFLSGLISSRIKIVNEIKSILKEVYIIEYFINRDIALLLHRLNIVAVGLVFLHVQLIRYLRENTIFMIALYIYTIPVFLLYFKFLYDNYSSSTNAKIVDRRALSDNTYEFTIKVKNSKKFSIGDFVFISIPNDRNLDTPHPFSIVGLPSDNNGNLILAIRGDGDFTKKIQKIKLPCNIKISNGFGEYRNIIHKSVGKDIIMIAGGIGITPFMSIVENTKTNNMKIFYSSSNKNNLIYREKLERLEKNKDNLEVFIKNSRFELNEIISELPSNKDNVVILLSGPLEMCKFWKKELKNMGIKSNQIFNEEFNW